MNRRAEIYMRLDVIEYYLACKDRTPTEEDELVEEKWALEEELYELEM